MKIEGNSADVRRISGDQTDMAHSIFVDAIDSHVKTDIVRGCVLNVLHDGVVGITANGVVPLAITVQTEQNQVSFRKLERKSAVGDNIDDQKTNFLCFDDQLPQGTVTVMPEEGFTSAKEENAHAHIVKLLHLFTNLRVGIKNRGNVVDRTVPALQITFVSENDGAENRFSFFEQDCPNAEFREMEKRRNFYIVPHFSVSLPVGVLYNSLP